MKMKKLLPALCMLLVSAILMGTSTYAWFSMNTTVSATGLEIKAKSNNTFLLIGESAKNTADLIQAQTGDDLITEALTVADPEVFPASPILPARLAAGATPTTEEIAANKYFASTHATVANLATAEIPGNWFTAQNNDSTSSNNTVKNIHELTAGGEYPFEQYVIKRTVYLTLADGSDSAHLLTVTPTIALKAGQGNDQTDFTAVRVLVACGSNYVILNPTMSTAQSLTGTADFTLYDTTATQVDIYVYYDGEAAAVRTENSAALAAATVDLAFDVTVGTASS